MRLCVLILPPFSNLPLLAPWHSRGDFQCSTLWPGDLRFDRSLSAKTAHTFHSIIYGTMNTYPALHRTANFMRTRESYFLLLLFARTWEGEQKKGIVRGHNSPNEMFPPKKVEQKVSLVFPSLKQCVNHSILLFPHPPSLHVYHFFRISALPMGTTIYARNILYIYTYEQISTLFIPSFHLNPLNMLIFTIIMCLFYLKCRMQDFQSKYLVAPWLCRRKLKK